MSVKKRLYLAGAAALVIIAILLYTLAWPAWQQQLTGQESARLAQLQAAAKPAATQQRLDHQQLLADLNWLAHPDRQGRKPGTPGSIEARSWLARQFAEIGLQPAGTDGYLQPFHVEQHFVFSRWLRGKSATVPAAENAANVLGLLPGLNPQLKPIVLTAHYDHLGLEHGEVFAGADDNASGVATLLGLARYFSEHPLAHPLLFVALDAEEGGLQGAVALFKHQLLQPEQLAFNVNMDMLSRDTDQLLFAVGSYQQPWLTPLLQTLQQQSAVKIIAGHDRPWYRAGNTQDWTLSSDHGIFYQQQVPFIYFGVADHDDYHSVRDTAEKVDPDFYAQVSETILSFIQLLDQQLKQH
ncbi:MULTISPECIES: M28 family peptidase [unclassified Arsukibacterium]|uniref:M28 family peptidase n=1 Tax=unclassified Arsukibacterium TaxID=2635278 RepID=UPI000C4F0A54|nr:MULTISPECIES: M28 family peptidase [unclassified Arsukibacterium]MAA94581.1 aminopeptidase [Rheinheimera sp.]MBM32836.1 aminopeptidase [Rheinheimera sp.]HAW93346.1 aminopeptidase [Candidatus Azambacteria bacterium]|tara:strand:- start:176 stop:1237 length:1062 start_codon:yes stop_codon:yes gene_type:complete